MKFIQRLYTALLLSSLIFSISCTKDTCIHGEGTIVSQNLAISDFSGFKLSGTFNIVLQKGPEIKVVATGQPNILNYISTSVENGIWNAEFEDGCYNDYQVTVYINHPNIKEFGINGSGSINVIGKLDSLENLTVYNNGGGNIYCSDSLLIDNFLNVDLSGSGSIELIGSALNQNINISGSGDYSAYNLFSENVTVSIPGSGDAMVHAFTSLEAFLSGSGSVYYIGDPVLTTNVTGSGAVINAN